jgi:hypothetical protein
LSADEAICERKRRGDLMESYSVALSLVELMAFFWLGGCGEFGQALGSSGWWSKLQRHP